jgi:predicted GTPase
MCVYFFIFFLPTEKKIRVIFLGATGNGKSTLCNDLLGINHFKAQANVGGGGISSIF